MSLIKKIKKKWNNINYPFLIYSDKKLFCNDLLSNYSDFLSEIESGDVVALIGNFDPRSISILLQLIDKTVIIVPLTNDTEKQHNYFFETALVNVIINESSIKRISNKKSHHLLDKLRVKSHSGLILFTTGTTGQPKAILHDLTLFLKRFETPRPTLRTINFLLFDHIGGLNTLFHTLFNNGTVVAPVSRNVKDILESCQKYKIEVLPTTPTFIRMMLMSGLIPNHIPKSLKIISYGTERMDQPTLDQICKLLPEVDFRQTYGMSELGIVRVKSESRDSLFMKIGGEGIKTRVVDNVLEIKSDTKMLGYLNSVSPFDAEGWYNTKDIVEVKDEYYKIIGRTSEVINVGGLKFMASEIEKVAIKFEGIELAKAVGKPNPLTGEHVELSVMPKKGFNIDKKALKAHLNLELPNYMTPKRLNIENIFVGHRFKRG